MTGNTEQKEKQHQTENIEPPVPLPSNWMPMHSLRPQEQKEKLTGNNVQKEKQQQKYNIEPPVTLNNRMPMRSLHRFDAIRGSIR